MGFVMVWYAVVLFAVRCSIRYIQYDFKTLLDGMLS